MIGKEIDLDKLYMPSSIDGSFFNRMLDCGSFYNWWVEHALGYLPVELLDEHKENLAFISTAQMDACRVARYYCENREVIFLSDRILPKKGASEFQPQVRYFIFIVLHETAHAIEKHKSPKFDKLTQEQNRAQEEEADELAFGWFNAHIQVLGNQYLPPLTRGEIEQQRQRNRQLMMRLYAGAPVS